MAILRAKSESKLFIKWLELFYFCSISYCDLNNIAFKQVPSLNGNSIVVANPLTLNLYSKCFLYFLLVIGIFIWLSQQNSLFLSFYLSVLNYIKIQNKK